MQLRYLATDQVQQGTDVLIGGPWMMMSFTDIIIWESGSFLSEYSITVLCGQLRDVFVSAFSQSLPVCKEAVHPPAPLLGLGLGMLGPYHGFSTSWSLF